MSRAKEWVILVGCFLLVFMLLYIPVNASLVVARDNPYPRITWIWIWQFTDMTDFAVSKHGKSIGNIWFTDISLTVLCVEWIIILILTGAAYKYVDYKEKSLEDLKEKESM